MNDSFEDQFNQTLEFNMIKKIIEEKKNKIYELERQIKVLRFECKDLSHKLQDNCKHEYVRECTTSGCYAEYHYICKHCNGWK